MLKNGCLYSIKGFLFDQTFPNVASGVLNGGVAVYIGQQTQAEAVAVVGGVGKAVHQHAGGRGLERFSHSIIQLIVHNRAPVLGFLIGHRLNICTKMGENLINKYKQVCFTLLLRIYYRVCCYSCL